jgi:hypothetical protein
MHRPLLEAKPPCPSIRYLAGWMETFTPPATAASHSPPRMLRQARWMAVSDDEHMVSRATLGPVKPQKKETRLGIEEGLDETTTGRPRSSICAAWSWYSSYMTPAKTPTRERPNSAGL